MNEKIIKMSIFDILCLPVFLYTYELLPVLFWIVLILVDSYEIKEIDIKGIIGTLDDIQKTDKRIMILSVGYMIGIGIIAFKNFALAGILIINELLVCLVSIVNLNNNENKNDK